ncbi:FUSC family protein (plasmid) [Streptomyces goshikiensis]|uniref:FUSC family protein n=1 Tax=Streptomyces goshikiensis TaxID=1942 RepID=UPI002F90E716|nr:FUSC family protein [Streptomyces goshikiensis]
MDVANSGEPDPAATAARPSGARRWLHILGAVVVAVVLPVAVAGMVAGQLGAQAVFLGVLLGVTGAKIGGTHRMLYLAPVTGAAAGLGALTAYDWWWAVLLAVSGAIAGAGVGFGWLAPLLMPAAAATFAIPASSGTDALISGIMTTLGVGYGIVIARRFGAAPVVAGDRRSPALAAVVAAVFAVALGAAAALGVALGWTEPFWVPESIIVCVLYIAVGKRERIRGKAIGTAVGVAAALPVAILVPSTWVTSAIATAAAIAALTLTSRYWLMYGLYTFALVLALAAPGQVATEAEHRGVEILAGIAILAVGLAAVHAIGNHLRQRSPQPELAPSSHPDVARTDHD